MAAFVQQPFPPQPQPQHFQCPVAGCGGVGSPGRGLPCPRHACKRKACPLPKADGSGYCPDHACDLVACSKSRLDTSRFCNSHACQYFQCKRCKRGVGTPRGASGDACEEHTCQAEGCLDTRRHKRAYCRDHSCRWSGRVACNQAVETGTMACRDHVCRYEEGCGNVRKVKSNSQACDDHTCASPKCYGAVGLRGQYCAEHTCVWEPCSKKGGVKGTPYCETHKCQTPTCQAPVASKVDWFCERHKCRYSGPACHGGWISMPPYCKDHTCAREGCDESVIHGGECCHVHTCKHIPTTTSEPLCLRGRKPGTPLCAAHICDKCDRPRVAGRTRCASHSKLYPKDHPQFEHHRTRGKVPTELMYTEERPEHEARKRRQAKVRTPTPPRNAHSPGKGGMDLMTRDRGSLTAATARLDLIPSNFRADPGQALAYGCGFRDACNHMAGMMTAQMESLETARPLSPSRHVAKVDGPRFTAVADDEI